MPNESIPNENIPNDVISDMNNRISNLENKTSNLDKLLFKIAEILLEIYKTQQKTLQELLDRREEGKAIVNSGIVLSTDFTIIDTQISPGHMVKGYTIRNTHAVNSIFFGFNITKQPQVDADIVDTLKANPIFIQLAPGEGDNLGFNTDCIKSCHLLAVSGTATYKIKLFW